MSAIAFGVNSGWSSPYLPYLLSNSSTIPTTISEGTWCATGMLAGCVIGAILAANIADRIGRKNSMLLLAPVTCLGFIGMAFATNIWHLTILRIIIGITDGAMYTILPIYIGEIVDADIRGFASSTICILLISGILMINIIGPYMSIFASSLFVSIFPALHFLLMLCNPESPYFYVKVEKYDLAKDSLRLLRGEDRILSDLDDLKGYVMKENEMADKSRFINLFTIPSNRKACLIVFLLMFANRMSGKTAIMFFTAQIFLESGSTIDATLSAIVYNIVELLVISLVTCFVIDKFGKKFLMIISCSGSSLTILLLAVYFYLKDSGSSIIYYLNWLPVTSLVGYNILFSIGINFGLTTYLSELFPMNVKANASCLGEVALVILSFLSSNFFQVTYIKFGMYFPETKGKTLAEIQDFLIESCKLETNLSK